MLTDGQSLGIGDLESLKIFAAEIREKLRSNLVMQWW